MVFMRLGLVLSAVIVSLSPVFAFGLTPWPGPDWQDARNLSYLDDFEKNLSGAHWDADLGTLYVVMNKPATIWSYRLQGTEFRLEKKVKGKGDYEGITKIPHLPDDVFVMGEKCSCLKQYDMSRGRLKKIFDLHLSNDGKPGPEGVTFIPNKFIDTSIGKGRHGSEGLMVVAHQDGGDLYFYDLDLEGGDAELVTIVATRALESSGLEFEASEAKLYIWHNIDGNSIEVVRPVRDEYGTLELVKHVKGPKEGNIEGIAVGRVAAGEDYLFFTDDDNQHDYALFWFSDTSL